MGALLLLPLYILANIYIILRSVQWFHACSAYLKTKWFTGVYSLVYVFFALSIVLGTFLPASGLQKAAAFVSNYWLGVLLYLLLFLGAADVLRFLLKRLGVLPRDFFASRRNLVIAGFVISGLVAGVCVYGALHAGNIKTRVYDVTVQKNAGQIKCLNVVLAADLHLGYSVGLGQVERMVEKINAQNPDLVVLAGDIFDNSYDAVAQPGQIAAALGRIQAQYGVYACYGNHDVSERILAGFTFHHTGSQTRDPRMDAFLDQAGIRALEDEAVLIADAFYLAGRIDDKKPVNAADGRKSPAQLLAGLDPAKPILVLDHEPRELQALADAGADVDLSGHTHNGQLFPGNLLIRLGWENPYGYLNKGNMHSIVTAGVGVWGPSLRVGTDSEIALVQIHFTG